MIREKLFRLLTWNSCIGQFVHLVGEGGERVKEVDEGYVSTLRVSLY